MGVAHSQAIETCLIAEHETGDWLMFLSTSGDSYVNLACADELGSHVDGFPVQRSTGD